MNRTFVIVPAALILFVFILGCSGMDNGPLTPVQDLDPAARAATHLPQTHLWGFYDVTIDVESNTVEVVPSRLPMFTANVVQFINGNPANLSFSIKNTVPGAGFVDVDIDVGITHPFPGMSAYNGYDVRGVFIGDGSAILDHYNLRYPVNWTDQFMMADPNDPFNWEYGRPDGYTRWYNPYEFNNPGLFGYTHGLVSTPGYSGTSRLNPYKYFADGIGSSSHFWQALLNVQNSHGVFSAGATIYRNYYLRFPSTKGIRFNYAIVANWENEITHPSNAIEAVAADIDVTDDLWYLAGVDSGGEIIADFSIFNWNNTVNGSGVMEEYQIFIESTVLSQPYQLNQEEMTPTLVTPNYCTYHIEVPADNITHVEGNEFWIIVEYPETTYSNPQWVPNKTNFEPVTSYFRQSLTVSTTPINATPVCDLAFDPVTPAFEDLSPVVVTFDATGSYDPDPKDTLIYSWDFDGDGVFGEDPDDNYFGTPDNPSYPYFADFSGDVGLILDDGNTGTAECSVPVDVITHQSKNLNLRPGREARDIAIDPTNGDLIIAYDDNTVYKYLRSGYYGSGSLFINTNMGYWATSPLLLDMNADRYTMIGGLYYSYNSSFIYNPDGTQLSTYFWLTWQSTACDVFAMGMQGDFAKDLCFMHGYIQTGTKHNIVRRHADPTYMTYASHDYSFTEIYYDGYDKIFFDYIVGCVSDMFDDYIWVLEDADYYVSRWELTAPAGLVFADAYFGTGSQTDADDGFWLPKDITRDNQNRLFVLDELSTGDPSVKVWTVDGATTTSIGSYGDSTTISEPPLRIEGSDFEGRIAVLHGSLATSYKLSVFHPVEMPGYTGP